MEFVMLGSGNVATHLSGALVNAGHKIVQVYSRNIANASELASIFKTGAIDNISLVNKKADLYIIAISDKAIASLLTLADFSKKNVVHTAGSVSLDVFPDNIENFGVFYPFQTFSKKRDLQFSNIPICIEANTPKFEEVLIEIAKKISNNVLKINSGQRKLIHLSGVFACNFVNHLYCIAANILSENKINENILQSLITETASKINDLPAYNAQTGPAIRNDTESIEKHLDLLSSRPEDKLLYKLFSESIYKMYKQK